MNVNTNGLAVPGRVHGMPSAVGGAALPVQATEQNDSIPHIAVLGENAVYDHYMRRLNKVWMRRIKASRKAANGTVSNDFGSADLRKVNARPTSVPPFIQQQMMAEEEIYHRRRRRCSAGGGDLKNEETEPTRAERRPSSAPTVTNSPTAAWAERKDRNHSATGPGPTSSRHRQYHGGDARPESAPTFIRGAHPRHAAAASLRRRRERRKHHPSAWLPPQVTRLELQTLDLLDACRKAGRNSGHAKRRICRDTAGACRCRDRFVSKAAGDLGSPLGNRDRHHGGHPMTNTTTNSALSKSFASFWEDEKLERLGRGAVIRMLGSLGMGRYAHRFRAFAVTGSDLASCTEDDLIQIGVSFRPHRLRLLRGIERHKGRRRRSGESGGGMLRATKFGSPAKNREGPEMMRADVLMPDREDGVLVDRKSDHFTRVREACPGVQVGGSPDDTEDARAEPTDTRQSDEDDRVGDATDVTASSTARTDSERVSGSHATEPAGRRRSSTSTEATAGFEYCSAEAAEAGRKKRGKGSEASEPELDNNGWEAKASGGDAQEAGIDEHPDARGNRTQLSSEYPSKSNASSGLASTPVVPVSHVAAERRKSTLGKPKLKGTLHVSCVRAGGEKVAVGGRDPFLRVRTCNQLRQTDTLKGLGTSPDDTVLSFRVTDQALTAHGVHIELCDGDVGIADPVAHGIIPGEVTVQLMYHLSSRDLHAGDHCPPPVSDSQERDSDYSSDSTVRCASRVESASGTENTARRAISSGVVVKVRLFAEADGEDVGTCVLNLKFRSDLPNKQRMHTPTTATKTSPNTRRDLEEQDLFENVGQETMSQGVEEVTTVNEMAEAKNGDRRYMKGEGTAATSTDADTLFASEGGAADPIEHATAPHEQMGKAIVEVETAPRTFAAAAVEVHEQRRNRECSLELLAETAKHIEAIEEVCQLVRRQHQLANQSDADEVHDLPIAARLPPPSLPQGRKKHYNEAAVVLQAFSRRRAASKLAKRRAEERTAANRMQAFARQMMATGICRQAREKQTRLWGRREEAATRIQGAARCRVAAKTVRQKRCDKGERERCLSAISEREAAAFRIQGLARRRISCRRDLKKKQQAATTLQGMARIREARADVRRRKERRVATIQQKRQHEQEAAASKIQFFTRRQTTSRAARLSAYQRQAAVRLQSLARSRKAKDRVHRRRERREILRTAARVTALDAVTRALRGQAVLLAEKTRHLTVLKNSDLARHSTAAEAGHLEVEAEAAMRSRGALELQSLSVEQGRSSNTCTAELDHSTAASAAAFSGDPGRDIEVTTHAVVDRYPSAGGQEGDIQGEEAQTVKEEDRKESDERKEDAGSRRERPARAAAGVARRAAARRIQHFWCCRRAGATAVKYTAKTSTIQSRLTGGLSSNTSISLDQVSSSSMTEEEAARRIQRVFWDWHSRLQNAFNTAKRNRQETHDIREQAAVCIQRALRTYGAKTKSGAMTLQSGLVVEGLSQRQSAEDYDAMRQQEHEAVTCIQRVVRKRIAPERVAAAKRQRDAESQREADTALEMQNVAREQAAARIQQRVRTRQAHTRTEHPSRDRDVDLQKGDPKAGIEAKRQGSAICIQCVVRRRQAEERVSALIEQRNDDSQRSRQMEREEFERERRAAVEDAAASCIQRATRCHHAAERVFALKRRRTSEVQHFLHTNLAREMVSRSNAATRIQRSVRSRHVLIGVAAMRGERDFVSKHDAEAELDRRAVVRAGAATCIQQGVRSRQALHRVIAARRQRKIDHQKALQNEERERILVLEQEAASCIQRTIRGQHAVRRVSDLKHQKLIGVERSEIKKHEKLLTKRADAALRVQQAVRRRQALMRCAELRRTRDVAAERRAEEEKLERRIAAAREEAAMYIQGAVRGRQAVAYVRAVRQQIETREPAVVEPVASKHEILDERDAAMRIQRAARCYCAIKRVTALRRKISNDTTSDLEIRNAKEMVVRRDAVEIIQRLTRSRQASARVSALRRQRDTRLQPGTKDKGTINGEATFKAAIQESAAVSIQRVARCRRAEKQVAVLRQEKVRRAGEEREKQTAKVQRDDAIKRIQRGVRVHQAVQTVTALKREKEIDAQRRKYCEAEFQTELNFTRMKAERREAQAAIVIQGRQRQRLAVRRADDKRKNVLEQEALEPISSRFARIVEAARQSVDSIAPPGTTAENLANGSTLVGDLSSIASGAYTQNPAMVHAASDLHVDERDGDSVEDVFDQRTEDTREEEKWNRDGVRTNGHLAEGRRSGSRSHTRSEGSIPSSASWSSESDRCGATRMSSSGSQTSDVSQSVDGSSRQASLEDSEFAPAVITENAGGDMPHIDRNPDDVKSSRSGAEAVAEGAASALVEDFSADNSHSEVVQSDYGGGASDVAPSPVFGSADDGSERVREEKHEQISTAEDGGLFFAPDRERLQRYSRQSPTSEEDPTMTDIENHGTRSGQRRVSASAVDQEADEALSSGEEMNSRTNSGGALADGWETHVDEESGLPFFYHRESQVTSWNLPQENLRDTCSSRREQTGIATATEQEENLARNIHGEGGLRPDPLGVARVSETTGSEPEEIRDEDSDENARYLVPLQSDGVPAAGDSVDDEEEAMKTVFDTNYVGHDTFDSVEATNEQTPEKGSRDDYNPSTRERTLTSPVAAVNMTVATDSPTAADM